MTAAMGARVLAGLPGLSRAGEVLVLAVLATRADSAGVAVMTWGELACQSRVSRSTLGRVLARLEEAGYVVSRSVWQSGGRGATVFRLASSLAGSGSDVGHVSLGVGIPEREPVSGRVSRVTGGVDVGDVLSAEGCRRLVRAAMDEGWVGPASEVLGQAAYVEARARLGWVARRRRSMCFEEAVDDVASRVWEVLRECADRVVVAESPWGLVTSIVVRRVARVDAEAVRVVAVEELPEVVEALDYERGVGEVLVEDLLEGWAGPHQVLVHRLVDYGVPAGLAWAGTRRLVEIAAGAGASERITRARADEELACLGVSAVAAGAWMSLIVGTRRAGPESSFVLRMAGGGSGVTDDEARRFAVVAREVGALRG